MKRICSGRSDFNTKIKTNLSIEGRGYPEEIVNKETKRALETSRGGYINKSKIIHKMIFRKGYL